MGKQISGRDRAKFDKVWALYRGTRYAGERNNAYTQAYRIAKKYGQTPESFAGVSSPPPEPPRSRQNGRADSGHNHHQQQRGKAHAGANSRQSGQSGRQTWQAGPNEQYQQEKQQQWRARERAKAEARYNREAYGEPPPRQHETERERWEREDAEAARRCGEEPYAAGHGGGRWRARADWSGFTWYAADERYTRDKARGHHDGAPAPGPHDRQHPRSRPSTARRQPAPDGSVDLAAVLVMAAFVVMFLSVAVLAALGGWLGIKQFVFVVVALAIAGVLLVNMVME